MYKNEQKKTYVSTPTDRRLLKIAADYDKNIEKLTERIDQIRAEISRLPSPDKLKNLEMRLEVLYCERRDLREASAHLKKLAAPPPAHPSLLYRERDAS